MYYKNIEPIFNYTPARLCTGKVWYIAYNAFNPETNKLEEKRIKINRIKKISERKKYANDIIKRINENLCNGWNPFINPEAQKSYTKLKEVINIFLRINEKKLNDGIIRKDTYKDYVSYLRNFEKWLSKDIYIYKLNRALVSDFLEHIYIERDRTAQTRNNYLNVLRVFAGFLLEKNYLNMKFTDGVKNLKKGIKQRTVISDDDLKRIYDYLKKENIYYLFACELLYYTFIRPNEMSKLKISAINFKNKTIQIKDFESKNKQTAFVTIPDSLGRLIMDLEIYKYPTDYFLFSDYFKPGPNKKDSKCFRDYWLQLRKALKLPANYKFYSFKDTGITKMLAEIKDSKQVRDQARHSSITITELYLSRASQEPNKNIVNLKDSFGK